MTANKMASFSVKCIEKVGLYVTTVSQMSIYEPGMYSMHGMGFLDGGNVKKP